MQYTTTLTLTQTGMNGPLSFNVSTTKQDANYVPEAYQIMTKLASVWFQIEPMIIEQSKTAKDNDGVEYKAELSLAQEGPGSPIFSKLELSPRVSGEDDVFPRAFEAGSYLAALYLNMVGVIDEEGNVIDEDALVDNVEIEAAPARTH